MSSHSMSGSERRRHLRLTQTVPLKISSDEVDIVTETQNLSCSGVCCRTNRRLDPMTKLKIHLLLPVRKNGKSVSKKISCCGVVVRAETVADGESFDTAIFFSDITPKDSQVVNEFIHSLLPERN